MTDIEALMKRCQIGVSRRDGAYDELHSILAECYGALGSLQADAARYRWLREGCCHKGTVASRIARDAYGMDWDACIDRAMKA